MQGLPLWIWWGRFFTNYPTARTCQSSCLLDTHFINPKLMDCHSQNYLESSSPEEAMDNPLAVARYLPALGKVIWIQSRLSFKHFDPIFLGSSILNPKTHLQWEKCSKTQSQVSSTIAAAPTCSDCCFWIRAAKQVGTLLSPAYNPNANQHTNKYLS